MSPCARGHQQFGHAIFHVGSHADKSTSTSTRPEVRHHRRGTWSSSVFLHATICNHCDHYENADMRLWSSSTWVRNPNRYQPGLKCSMNEVKVIIDHPQTSIIGIIRYRCKSKSLWKCGHGHQLFGYAIYRVGLHHPHRHVLHLKWAEVGWGSRERGMKIEDEERDRGIVPW